MVLVTGFTLSAQELSGIITKKGKPKKGMVVKLLGTNETTTTDKYGRFHFDNAAPGDVLQVDITSRKAARMELSEARRLRIYIATSDFVLNNGKLEQRLPYTALAADVKSGGNLVEHDQIMASGMHRVSDLLKNFVTGVTVIQNQMTSHVTLRGPSSVMGENEPLFVVDGMIYDSLDEVDRVIPVESIERLFVNKEGVGWGARGGNGVIEITTLKGNEKS